MADLKEIVDRSTALFNAHDAEGLAAMDHPDVVFSSPGPTGRTELRGREAAKEYNQGWFDAFPDARISIITEVIGADTIVIEGTFQGTNTGAWKSSGGDMPATGKTLKGQYVQVSKVRDGQVISGSLYFDQLEVMSQLGLMQSPAEARA